MANVVRFLALGLSLAALMAGSQAAHAQDPMISPRDVAGSATVPVDGDIVRYRTVLAETEEGADLFIYTDAGEGWVEAVEAPGIVWRGAMYGQEPWLEVTESGTLKLHSENSAVGRNRWEQVLTIAYRDNTFLVAGYTFSHYDTLDPDGVGECDVNLLTGSGVLNGKNFRTTMKAPPVGDWTRDTMPPECVR